MMVNHHRSFKRSAWLFYGIACLFPYLVGVYLILELKITFTYTLINILGLTLILILLGAMVIELFSRRLRYIANRVAETVREGMVEKVPANERDVEEIFMLATDFNVILDKLEHQEKRSKELTARMLAYVSKLDSYEKKLREELLIRSNLSRYVGSDMVEELVRMKQVSFENVECTATIFFADIRGFTTLAENLEPEEIIEVLNRHFSVMVPIVFEQGGTLDKFIGDELMAVFRDHPYGERAPLRAIRAGISMMKAVEELNANRGEGYQKLKVGIGINTGKVVIGNVGSENRKDYTAIGDTVNVAARFEQMAVEREIIVGDETYQVCREMIPMEEFGTTVVRNRKEPVRAYKVLIDDFKL
jgi:class 3 adenylate cyclase